MQDYSWYTCWLVPFYHFLGINDTGIMFMCYWSRKKNPGDTRLSLERSSLGSFLSDTSQGLALWTSFKEVGKLDILNIF